MGTKKRPVPRKQQTTDDKITRIAGGVLLCGASIVLLACFFLETQATPLNGAREIMWGLGGAVSVAIPILMLWVGGLLTFSLRGMPNMRRFVAVSALVLCVMTMLQLFMFRDIGEFLSVNGRDKNFVEYVRLSFQDSRDMFRGGGAVGAILAYPLWLAVDIWGTMIILILVMLVCLLLCINTSPSELAGFFGIQVDKAKEQFDQMLDDRDLRKQQAYEARQQYEEQRQYEYDAQRQFESQQYAQQEAFVPQMEYAEVPPYDMEPPKKKSMFKGLFLNKEKQEPLPQLDFYAAPYQDDWEQRVAANDTGYYKDSYSTQDDPYYDQYYNPQESMQPAYASGGAVGGYAEYGIQIDDSFPELTPEEPPQHRLLSFPTERVRGGTLLPWQQEVAQTNSLPDDPWGISYQEQPQRPQQQQEHRQQYVPPPRQDEPVMPSEPAAPENQPSSPQRVFRLRKAPERSAQAVETAPAPQTPIGEAWIPEDPHQAKAEEPPRRLDGSPLVLPQKQQARSVPQAPQIAYPFPPIRLLKRPAGRTQMDTRAKDEANAAKLIHTLKSFGVSASVIGVSHGPAITRFEVQPAPGVKVSRIVNLVDDIALNMAAAGVRIEAPIPGKAAVGIEIPNDVIETVSLSEIIDSREMQEQKSGLSCALGRDIAGNRVITDLSKMPHVLIAGATGSGKSVCINTLIVSLLYRSTPEQVRMILIDPKVVELSVYNGVPHLLVPVVTDPKKASGALAWAVAEMERRYAAFAAYGVRDIRGYNAMPRTEGEESMPLIMVVIDELADLMMVAPGEVEDNILRLAQKARAAGIHLVIATQRPSVNVITGVIKANIPSRIAFAVSSQVDSRTILDMAGAEKLLGKGDMLYAPQGIGKPKRVQGCFVSDEEVAQVVQYIKQRYETTYNEDVEEFINAAETSTGKDSGGDKDDGADSTDELLPQAIEMAVESGQASISMLQRRLRVGYARAGRLVDEMARRGVIGQAEGAKPREVLITREQFYEQFGNATE